MLVAISGTSSGIGKAIAEKFLKEGHTVWGFDIAKASIFDKSYTHILHDIQKKVNAKIEPDILINSAGTFDDDNAIKVNLEGAIEFVDSFVSSANLKSILFIASASARNGSEFPKYVASKAGVVGYMKNLALNLSKRHILCNSISPGGVITESNGHIINNPSLYDAVKAETLLGKWAESKEVAELAYYLTVVNRSITGEDILIDNGEMLKSNFIW